MKHSHHNRAEAQKPGYQGSIATRKVFARPESFCAYNRKKPFKLSQYFQNYPDFSRLLPIFRMVSKLSRFVQITAHFPDYFKTVRIFPDYCQISGLFQNCTGIFPENCQFSGFFQKFSDFPDDCQFYGLFQNVQIFPDDCLFSG